MSERMRHLKKEQDKRDKIVQNIKAKAKEAGKQ